MGNAALVISNKYNGFGESGGWREGEGRERQMEREEKGCPEQGALSLKLVLWA